MTKILLVDDEPDIVMLCKNMLEKAGYEVVVARNGQECLERLIEEHFDLILLDVMMPGDNGWVVCRKIKSNKVTRDIPVVMFTVCSEPWLKEKGKEAGADAQIDKPFELEDLLGTIERVLAEDKD
ncbi:response regulator [archaeon]|nr:response regulator [archaeon]